MGLFDGKVKELGDKIISGLIDKSKFLLKEAQEMEPGHMQSEKFTRALVLMDVAESIQEAVKE